MAVAQGLNRSRPASAKTRAAVARRLSAQISADSRLEASVVDAVVRGQTDERDAYALRFALTLGRLLGRRGRIADGGGE